MADPEHDVARVIPAVAAPPAVDLRFEIGSGLTGERRIGRPHALASLAVAVRASCDPALPVAALKQSRRGRDGGAGSLERHCGIEAGNLKPLASAEMLGDPTHLRMPPASVGKCLELTLEVARIERSEPGRTSAIAFAAQSMTREAGVGGSRPSAAERDKLAALRELVARPRFKLRAARKQGAGCQRDRTKERGHFPNGTSTTANRFPLAISMISAFAMCTAACKPPPDQRQSFPTADAGRGKRLVEEVGCAACHTIGGIDWPQGRAAPELRGLTGRALIAGKVPNSPENLAAFVRNAPAVAPGTTMPPMPLSEQESRDVAAYLYEIGS